MQGKSRRNAVDIAIINTTKHSIHKICNKALLALLKVTTLSIYLSPSTFRLATLHSNMLKITSRLSQYKPCVMRSRRICLTIIIRGHFNYKTKSSHDHCKKECERCMGLDENDRKRFIYGELCSRAR